MRSRPGHGAGHYGLPRWGRGSKRRVARIRIRGNWPSVTMSIIWLTLVLSWCATQFWCSLDKNLPDGHPAHLQEDDGWQLSKVVVDLRRIEHG